jgi:hypothetical protein
MNLTKLLPKKVKVEQIHEEFDTAEKRILNECNKILQELNIPTETQIEKKASIMQELGFVNSETVNQAKELKQKSEEIKKVIDITSKQAESIKYFKQKYPLDKFITVSELERICEKYKLIHAPAANYIKDVPEKNVLEMKNRKILDFEDSISIFIDDKCMKTKFINEFPKYFNPQNYKLIGNYGFYIDKYKKLEYLSESEVNYCKSNNISLFSEIKDINQAFSIFINNQRNYLYNYTRTDKSGLFIAAPKSHFNLKDLSKKSKYGFFNVTIHKVKDPIAFEYCKNDICRIVTKWGTDDDQSYLDPILSNETLN